jgi:thiamine monophosphate synthase
MVFDAGADAIAVISAVFAAPDPYLAIDQFLEVIHAISF